MLALGPACASLAQTPATQIILNQPDAGNKTYVARERVSIRPGYTYTAGAGTTMRAYIDENLVFDASYVSALYNNSTFNARALDTNLPIGTIDGSHDVNSSGASNYIIPVVIPPGTNNMTPALSIAYSSMNGDGPMGMGWNLAGLSIISRTGKDIYHDNETGPVKSETVDALVLDGQRLILFSGTYGTNGATYRTESESFTRITSYGAAGNGAQWFKVEMKNGTTMEYGNSANSRYVEDGGSSVLFWRISKIYDVYGNYVEFKYKNDNSDSRIDEILYTGNVAAGLAPYNRIKFYYDNRQDVNTTYINGTPLSQKYLLTRIRISAENGVFKTYEFKYGKDALHTYLHEIYEYGSDESKLNATALKYMGFNSSLVQLICDDIPADVPGSLKGTDIVAGDYNGDGLTDIAALPFEHTSDNIKFNTSLKIYLKENPDGGFTGTGTASVSFAGDNTIVKIDDVEYPTLRQLFSSDFNGDGRDDIALVKREKLTSGGIRFHYVRVYRPNSNASGWIGSAPVDYQAPPTYIWLTAVTGGFFVPADFDGDGRSDYFTVLIRQSTFNAHAFLSFPELGELNKEISGIPGGAFLNDKIYPLDYDGDGKSELMVISGTTCKIYTFRKNAGGQYEASEVYSASYPTKDHEIYLGDFNGDRKTDLFTSFSGGWDISLSKGKGNAFSSSVFTFNTPFVPYQHKLTVGDYNGDGMSDIRQYYSGSGNNPPAYNDVYYSKGNSTFSFSQHVLNWDNETPFNGVNIVGDFNGDGREDVVVRNGSINNKFRLFYLNSYDRGSLLEKIANGYNHVTAFQYIELAQKLNYVKGTASVYPLNDISPSLPVVRQVKIQNGNGTENTIDYSYEEARAHLRGRGFLGFKKMTVTNNTLGQKSSQEFEINSTYYISLPKKQTIKLTDETLVSTTENNYEFYDDPASLRYWPKLKWVKQTDHIISALTQTDNTWDDATGNLTQSIANINNGLEITTTTNSQFNSNGSWLANKPEIVQVTNVRSSQSAYSTTTRYTYNVKGYVFQEIEFDGLPKAVTKEKTYDAFGNPVQIKFMASGLSTRTNSFTYDPKGRYAMTATNPFNQTINTIFDPRWGKPTEVTGIDGLKTTYEYDAFGSLKKKTTPEGHIIETSWTWDINSTNNTVYYTTAMMPGKPDQKVWYDKLNRTKKTQTEGFNGYWINSLVTYDNKGNISTTTTPHYDGASSSTYVTTTNNYDKFNRIETIVNSAGTTQYSYAGSSGQLTTTVVTPDGQQTSKTIDATGLVVSATDFGGTLNYIFDSQGNQTEVKLGTQTLITTHYDPYRRQDQLVDANAGPTSYIYNAFGELQSQTDANSNTHTMVYDLLGRVTSRTGPEGLTTYEYYSTGNNGVNLLKKVTGFNGVLEEYTYDGFNRMLTSKTTVDGISYTTTFGYDVYGNNTSVGYPSGFGITRIYDAWGYLKSVKNAAQTITLFNAVQLDALGNYTSYSLGNGYSSSNTYDKYGLPDRFTSGTRQDLDFTFNVSNGNLTGRNDLLKSKNETFLYHNNRIQYSYINGVLKLTTNFQAGGNISSKSDAGASYIYHLSKVNAVEDVTNPTLTFSSNTQNITYTPYHQPNNVSEGVYNLQYTYGPNYQRVKSVLKQSGTTIDTRYYFGNYEVDVTGGTTRHIHYISGGDGLISIVVRTGGADAYYYVYKDYLGSILTVTDNSGAIVAEQNFDPWGRYRSTTTWDYLSSPPVLPAWLYRGYTGHEHLPQFALINMNGRMYDPQLGRMLSVDNFVANGLSSQAFNRYSYALNNPLKYTDPNGEWVHIVAGALIGGFINGIIHADEGVGGFFKGFAIGAVAGAATALTGGAAAGLYSGAGIAAGAFQGAGTIGFFGGAIAGSAGAVVGSPILGVGNNLAFGDKYTWGDYGRDIVLGGAIGGLAGGIAAKIKGVNFWTGKSPANTPGTLNVGLGRPPGEGVDDAGSAVIREGGKEGPIEIGDIYFEAFDCKGCDKIVGTYKGTGTVWDDIIASQPNYSGSVLPKSFELATANGTKVWVHGNATEHIAEYLSMKAINSTPEAVRLATQQQLRSLQSAVDAATKNGIIYDQLIQIGGWELKFGMARVPGQLPVLFHAIPIF